jgi:hypothetical protein
MPSLNVLRNVNLALERRGGGVCPNTSLYPLKCGTPELTYTALSFDEVNQKWYPTNSDGFFTPDTGSTAGTITGSAALVKIYENGCPYPAVYFSGSASFPINSDSINLAIVTGSFEVSGVNTARPGNEPWNLAVSYLDSGSLNVVGFKLEEVTAKDAIVGIKIGSYFPGSQQTSIDVYVSGSYYTGNPPVVDGAPWNLGTTFLLQGEGIIRSFGFPEGTTSQQTQYNCLYGSTPSK